MMLAVVCRLLRLAFAPACMAVVLGGTALLRGKYVSAVRALWFGLAFGLIAAIAESAYVLALYRAPEVIFESSDSEMAMVRPWLSMSWCRGLVSSCIVVILAALLLQSARRRQPRLARIACTSAVVLGSVTALAEWLYLRALDRSPRAVLRLDAALPVEAVSTLRERVVLFWWAGLAVACAIVIFAASYLVIAWRQQARAAPQLQTAGGSEPPE